MHCSFLLAETMYKTIPEYPDYKVNEYGHVISFKNSTVGIPLKSFAASNKYRNLELVNDDGPAQYGVHRLVVHVHDDTSPNMLFRDDKKIIVNHKDGDKSNNHISNLEWCDYTHNMNHALETGLNTNHGMTHWKQRYLTDQQVDDIRAEFTGKWGEKKALAAKYNVPHQVIGEILNGVSRRRNADGSLKEIEVKRSKLTPEERAFILASDLNGRTLAKQFGVSDTAIYQLRKKASIVDK